jgi:hypothetical protein|tara:strand:+ start:609 stop:719 length:111 start_codon:yes stop_codon:yes gene_type:complete
MWKNLRHKTSIDEDLMLEHMAIRQLDWNAIGLQISG